MEDLVLGMNQGRMMLRSDILEMLHLEEEDLDNIREDLDAEMENIEGIFNTWSGSRNPMRMQVNIRLNLLLCHSLCCILNNSDLMDELIVESHNTF